MDVHHLRVFASVFKHKSFSKASEELHLTQPTVSDHVRALEEELKCKLFDRVNRRIIPTSEGMALIGRAVEVVEKVESMKDFLDDLRKDISGHLVLGASTIPGTYILPGLTASFRHKHPSVLFEILVSDSRAIIDKVAEHSILIGIVGAKLEAKQLQYDAFLDDELIAVGGGSIGTKKSISISELTSFPLIVREQGSGTRREFEKILEREGMDPHQLNIAGIFGSTDAIKQAVKEGMGISIVSRRSVKDELKFGILKEIKIKDANMKRKFYIITHQKRSLPHLYKIFLDYMFSEHSV